MGWFGFEGCGVRMRDDGVATGVEGLRKGRVVQGRLVCGMRMHSF